MTTLSRSGDFSRDSHGGFDHDAAYLHRSGHLRGRHGTLYWNHLRRCVHGEPHFWPKPHRYSDGGTQLHNPRYRSTGRASALSLFNVLYA